MEDDAPKHITRQILNLEFNIYIYIYKVIKLTESDQSN